LFVKICGITRPADASAAVDAGADAIGLNFVPSSRRHVDVETARAILAVVPDDVMTVGVFQGHTTEEVMAITTELGLVAVQLHGDVAASIPPAVGTVIRAVEVDGATIALPVASGDDIVMLDGPASGSGVAFDWDLVGDLVARHRILLAGGLSPDTVGEAVRRVRPWGVDVASGVESEPGRKDPDLVARFVAAARAAFVDL
jgi:phosphoribosylanthranilate isomerase